MPEAHLLGLAVAVLLHRRHPWVLPGPRSAHVLLGMPLIGAGGHLIARSVRAARQVDLARPAQLVVLGPYAVSRNPMYAGWALLHLGAALAGGSGWAVAALVPVGSWMHGEVLREERVLTGAFGEEFRRYRERVPRYLPRLARAPVTEPARDARTPSPSDHGPARPTPE
ncbi:methyltransferase family protein [Streptomyces vilmorinianum]|uniref:methyltransferase family protein n=1 Tax=Streptomyces vilmorinianum TaxID=3051092 RepID=UPI0010FB4AC1|nr:isoprenylcysteine carboxylmethyltransferase family protein [Streptomyces vilmorinianum]